MVDITSLKIRLARLRLGSEFEDKHPELRDPASDALDKKRGRKKKQKKAAQDPYNEYTKNTDGKRKKKNKLTRSDQKRGSLDAGYGDYTKNTGGKRKKKNKLTRSDQKRGKKVKRSRAQDNKENRKNKSGKPPTIGGYDPDLDY